MTIQELKARKELVALAAQVEGLTKAVQEYLANDGSYSCYDATKMIAARKELQRLITLTPPVSLALHDAGVLQSSNTKSAELTGARPHMFRCMDGCGVETWRIWIFGNLRIGSPCRQPPRTRRDERKTRIT